MEVVIDALSWILLLGGAFFMVTAGIGVLRLPDVYTRSHAAGMKDTLGLALTIMGLILQAGFTLVTAKLVLIWLFVWFTSPVASHSTARAALLAGVRPILAGQQAPGAEGATEAAEAARADIRDGEGTV